VGDRSRDIVENLWRRRRCEIVIIIDKMEVRVLIVREACSTCTQDGRPSDESDAF
jgi:hypothetical protein